MKLFFGIRLGRPAYIVCERARHEGISRECGQCESVEQGSALWEAAL